jgi:four helix bundle protein
MKNYKQLEVWQNSRKLAVHVYRQTARFPTSEAFGLVAQMRRAAISVASNIAEAHGRDSSKDRVRVFGLARGSLFELEMQVLISGDLGFLSERQSEILVDAVNILARQLNALIRYYRGGGPKHDQRPATR